MRLFVAACVLSALAVPASARSAEPASPDWLTWDDRPDGCPSPAELGAKIGVLLGQSPAEAAARAAQRIVLRVEREATPPPAYAWSADVTMVDPRGGVLGRRRISKPADTCGPISDAIALIVVLSLSQSAAPEPTPAAPAPEPARELSRPAPSPPKPAPPSPEPTAPPAARQPPWTLALDAGLAASAGMLPNPSPGAQGRVRLAPPAWPALYGAFTLWKQETQHLGGGPSATLALWTLGLGACHRTWSAAVLSFELCGGGEAGRMRATGFGIVADVDKEVTGWFLDLAAGGLLEGRLGHGLRAGVALQVAVPLTRSRVLYHDPGNGGADTDIWRMWPVFPLAFLYVGYAFR